MPEPLSVGPGETIRAEHLPDFLQPTALRETALEAAFDVLSGDVAGRPGGDDEPIDLTLLAEVAAS